MIENCCSTDSESRSNFGEIFEKLTNEEYFIDDVVIDEISTYIQDITENRDPIEKLIKEKEISENEKNQLKIENEKLNEVNIKLLDENKKLSDLNSKLLNENKIIESSRTKDLNLFFILIYFIQLGQLNLLIQN